LGEPFHYDALPVFEAFERVSDPTIYEPLPADWQVGVADVVSSTEALRSGRYKAVNMAGAAVVSAVKNVCPEPFPFVFGGDGAVLAVPPESTEKARAAMAATATFVAEELQLVLRVGMIPVSAIREAGQDFRVARYAASPEAVYAMFSGGGASFAEAELKAGRIEIAPASAGARPDLSGLSCRWSPIASRHGIILSILVTPAPGVSPDAFRAVAAEVIRLTESADRGGHPLPPDGPRYTFPSRESIVIEGSAAQPRPGNFLFTMARVAAEMAVAIVLDRTGRKLGPLDVRHYRRWVTRNSDFRKYDDALRMTIDCTPDLAARLEELLAEAEAGGKVEFGLHRQDAALVTCIVPSVLQDDHLHFLDGAGGGYALAAKLLKEKLAARLGAMAPG
jgi:hypothetical protein